MLCKQYMQMRRKNMKRFIRSNRCKIIVCALCITFILSSCGKNEKTNSGQTSSMKTLVTEKTTETADMKTEETTEIANSKTENNIDSEDDFEELVEKDVEATINELKDEYEELKAEINTYDKYKNNTDKVEEFYSKAYESQKQLIIRLGEYSIIYTEMIVNSNISTDDMYDELETLYDVVYDDAGDDIYEEIYSGILEDVYDEYYSGILEDAYETVEYSEWSDLRSDEYDMWSDTRSEVYDNWSDFRSDLYDFWSDIRSELWDGDVDKAVKKIDDFKEDVDKLK